MLKTNPLVSIITPCFNAEKYIEETILSVKNQSYKNIEHIIIDGGSTDSTTDIIKKYASHIKYWISEPDNGMYDAINKGMNIAIGDIKTYLNADDFYEPNTIELVARTLDTSKQTLLYGDFFVFHQDNNKSLLYKSGNLSKQMILALDRMPFSQPSSFWSSQLWDEIGPFDTKYRYCGDFDFFSKVCLSQQTKIQHINQALSYFRLHEEALSTCLESMDKEHTHIYQKNNTNKIPFVKLKKIVAESYLKAINLTTTIQSKL